VTNFYKSGLQGFCSLHHCLIEFDTSVICHVINMHCLGSFLLQDVPLSFHEFAFEGQKMKFTMNMLLSCILYCQLGLAVIRTSHRKEIRKLTFRALALCWSESSDSLRRRANARNVSFRISLRWLIHIINPVDKPNYLVILPTDAAPQFL